MKRKGYFKKLKNLRDYSKKQIPKKVKKYFMSDKEFLAIYELYKALETEEDWVFLINVIESSKTYKHYKNNPISYLGDGYASDSAEVLFNRMKNLSSFAVKNSWIGIVFMEWLFTRTVHTSSLEVVSFSK